MGEARGGSEGLSEGGKETAVGEGGMKRLDEHP